MKRIALAASIGLFLATMAVAQNAPLGDYARQARKQKGHQPPAAKKFDNNNLPTTDRLSVNWTSSGGDGRRGLGHQQGRTCARLRRNGSFGEPARIRRFRR